MTERSDTPWPQNVLAAAFVVVWIMSIGLLFLDRNGQWSAERSELHPIPMNMHGSVAYLSPWQKFLYYDAFTYCVMAGMGIGAVGLVLQWAAAPRLANAA